MNRSWSEGFERRLGKQPRSNASSRPASQQCVRLHGDSPPGPGSPLSMRPASSPNTLFTSNSLPSLNGDRPLTAPDDFDQTWPPAKKRTRLDDFLGRQNTSTQDLRTKTSLLHRQVLHRDREEERKVPANWGNHGVTGFRKFLRKRFGTIPAAWRLVLDRFSRGHISFGEFCAACRFTGFCGHLQEVWACLDTDLTGHTSLAQLHPAADRGLRAFGVLLKDKYGSIEAAWKEGLCCSKHDVQHEVKIDEKDFCERAVEIGYRGNTKKLFKWMLNDRSMIEALEANANGEPCHVIKQITLPELEAALKHHQERMKDDSLMESTMTTTSGFFSGSDSSDNEGLEVHRLTRNARSSMDLGKQQRLSIQLEAQMKTEKDVGAKTLDELKAILMKRYGSLWKGWREVFDGDGNGRVSWGEFSLCLRELGYAGNFKALWEGLDSEECGFVSFGDIDPKVDRAIQSFKKLLVEKHGNILTGWFRALDIHRNSRVNEHRFVECCESIGWAGNPRWLFRLFQPEPGRKFVTLRDFDVKAFNALIRDDFRMMSEGQKHKNISNLTFTERQEMSFSAQWARALTEAQRFGIKEQQESEANREVGAGNLESFKSMLIRKFGTLPCAWRNHLDKDANGKLSFAMFCTQVRKMGYVGNLKALWMELDEDGSGFISLKELHPEAYMEMTHFRELLNKKYGNVHVAWKKCLDVSRNGTVEEDEFIQQSRIVGYMGDAKQLYKWFLAEPGRRFLTMGDIDPEIMAAVYRGDTRMLTKKTVADERFAPAGTEEASRLSLHSFTEGDKGATFALSQTRADSDSKDSKIDSAQRGSTINALWSEQLGKERRISAALAQEKKAAKRMGARNVEGFKKDLLIRFGSITTAWRQALDTDGNGRLSFGEFCMALRDLSFNGNLKALWAELHSEGGLVSLHDLDSVVANGLEKFRNFALEKYDNLVATWYKGLDVEGNIRLTQVEFVDRCSAIGFDGNAKQLFKWLLPEPGKRHIVVDDLETLLIGVSTNDRPRIWHGEKKAPAPIRSREMMEIRSLEGFKKLLVRHFGSIYSGWRKGLDPDGIGMVTQSGFAKTCRTIGFMGNGRQLWNLLDENKDGIISLTELDQEVGEKIGHFIRFLKEKYGTILEAWKKGLDVDGNKRIDRHEFIKRCKVLGYPGDAKELFSLFRPEVGRTFITLDDLGEDAKQALHHGMESATLKSGEVTRYYKRGSYY